MTQAQPTEPLVFFSYIHKSICAVLTTEILIALLCMMCTQMAEIQNSIVIMYRLEC